MRITPTADKLVLHRYAGQSDDPNGQKKSTMARIGTLERGTKSDAIPEDLKQDLTPRELRELVEYLREEQAVEAARKLAEFTKGLEEMIGYAISGFLNQDERRKLDASVSDFTKRLRRIVSEKDRGNVATTAA